MHYFPNQVEEKLGFDRIRTLLEKRCASEIGAAIVSKIKPLTDVRQLDIILKQTKEMKSLLESDQAIPSVALADITGSLKQANIPGSWLSPEEFKKIRELVSQIHQLAAYFKGPRQEKYPNLYGLAGQLIPFPALAQALNRIFDDAGEIRSNASRELQTISQRLAELETQVRKKLQALLKTIQQEGWGPETGITMRNDRLVVALFAEHKKKINGLVHDVSATGQTLFVEPAEALDLNNQVREWQESRKREIVRILTELTDLLRPEIPALEKASRQVGMLDFIRAKALLAIEMSADMPQLVGHAEVNWISARHPLLVLHHKPLGKSVVPFSLTLNRKAHILLISGPNAGGKSIALQAVGLLQVMLQSGLLVPAMADSKVGLFRNLFVDIGDDQNLDNDLSTYSSHLAGMRHFLEHGDARTLFLIDEFGTGTDPQFGGPIAEAILEQINRKGSFGVVNTHYSNLKIFADRTPGLMNGCMLFDQVNMMPTYQLETGKPGSSFAFEIATKMGLPKEVIDNARRKSGFKQQQVDELLAGLNLEKSQFRSLRADLEREQKNAKKIKDEYEAKYAEFQAKRTAMLAEAKAQAKQLLHDTNQKIESTIREIRESKAEKKVTQEARKTLATYTQTLLQEELPVAIPKKGLANVQVGDWVKLADSTTWVEVFQVSGKKAEVGLGQMRSWVNWSEMSEKQEKKVEKSLKAGTGGMNLQEKMTTFNAEINVIGKRGEEATEEVLRFVDEALLLGFDRVRIIHGRGTGQLRQRIRQELKRVKSVKSVGNELPEMGGDAITVVNLV